MGFFDRSFFMFLLIGAGNTVLSFLLMQGMYALGLGGYWLSSAFAFAVTSVLSFVLNKRLSFRNHESVFHTAWRFALVIAVCYVLAYSAARPAVRWLLDRLALGEALPVGSDQAAMLAGQVIFTGLNYVGQRFFAFRDKKQTH